MKHVLITGATGQIGEFLLPLLVAHGYSVTALSRSRQKDGNSGEIRWLPLDISASLDINTLSFQVEILIHSAPLPLLPEIIQPLAGLGLKRIIAFGTTSVFTKAGSTNSKESTLVESFTSAERKMAEISQSLGIKWTLFRPTLIYGGTNNSAILFMERLIGKFGFFPILGEANGLRQPVHAQDLAKACIQALDSPATYGGDYNLGGGEVLSYRKLLERVFIRQGKKPHLPTIPAGLFRSGIKILRLIPKFSHLTPEMADRMNQDHCFDISAATNDFGYSPREFLSRPEE